MTSNRPYLLRAIREWIIDNGLTPHILVDATCEDGLLPVEHASEGKLVLNISPSAVRDLIIGNDEVGFHARFAGRSREIRVPVPAVLAIYARENGKGMVFGEERPDGAPEAQGPRGRPVLKVVK